MGCYINPVNESKETFLATHAESPTGSTTSPDQFVDGSKFAVCWVNNGPFTAAAVCFSQRELEAFTDPMDSRPKRWFMVEQAALEKVSDIKNYLRG